MERLRVLSIAVASGKVGYVLFVGKQPTDWSISRKASLGIKPARTYVNQLIARFRPDVVVTEHVTKRSRKSSKTLNVIKAVADAAVEAKTLHVTVPRKTNARNKYEEAEVLCVEWPDLCARKPKRPRLWESEPRSTILFEAASLAKVIFDDPTNRLAAALG